MDMHEGQRVEVQLAGEGAEWFAGTVLDRPRKQWVQLDDPPSPALAIADESNIRAWRPLAPLPDPR